MQSDSDSQTIDQIHSPITIQYLVNQNKMKQIALNKATNLIDLLKIQLEVQKNSHEQSIKIMEEDLRYRYEMEIMRLNQKIQSLQYQLKLLEKQKEKEKGKVNGKNSKLNQMTIRKSNTYFQPNNSNSNGKFKFKDFTGRESPMLMMRTNNSEQLQKQKRRKFSNKKIISKNSISRIQNNNNGQQGQQQSRYQNQLQFSYKEKLQKFDKNLLISWILTSQKKHQQEFQSLTQQYQNSLIQIIQQKEKIKSSVSQINYMFQKQRKKSIQQQKKQNQYKKFIEAQKQFIIQLSKELQQVHEAFGQMRGSLSSFVLLKNINYQQQEVISGRHVLEELNLSQNYLRAILMQNRKKIKEKVQLMENQNIQLKDILDNMIRLVKSNKKIQIL